MHSSSKTKQQLLEEIYFLKQRNQELEESAAQLQRTAEALRKSNELLQEITTDVPGVVYQFYARPDGEFGLYYISAQSEQVVGLKPDLDGFFARFASLIIPEHRDGFIKSIEKAVQELTVWDYEGMLQKPSGEKIWFSGHSTPASRKGEIVFNGIIFDITKRKLVEETLQKSWQMIRALFDQTFQLIGIIATDGTLVKVNKTAMDFAGISEADYIGKSFWDTTWWTHSAEMRNKLHEAFTKALKDHIVRLEVTLTAGDGSIHFIDFSLKPVKDELGKIIFLVSEGHNITQRKKLEDALSASEERFRLLIENSHDIIYTLSPEGIFTFVSASWTTLLGHRVDQVLGEPFQAFVHPDDAGKCEVFLRQVLVTGERLAAVEYRVKHANGSWQWHSSTGTCIRDKAGMVVGYEGIARDVTERKVAEDALRESEQTIRALFDQSLQHIGIIAKDGTLLKANRTALDFAGIAEDDCIGKPLWNTQWAMHSAEMQNKVREAFTEALKDKIVRIEVTLAAAGGNIHFIDFSVKPVKNELGKIIFLIGEGHDITQRKRLEEGLRQSEAALRSVFKATPVGICIMKNRVHQHVNNFWLEIFGYEAAEIIGQTPRVLYETQEEYERVGRELYSNFRERDLASVETRLKRKDGVLLDALVAAAPLQVEDISSRMIVVIEDITERKRVMAELAQNRRELADIIEFLPDAIVVINKEGKVIAWNRAMETMTGIKNEDMLGKGNQEYAIPFYGYRRPLLIDLALHPDKEIEKQYTAIRRTGEIVFGEAFTPNLLSGNTHLYATASVLHDNNGNIIGAIECIRDNTERKKLEDRLKRAEKMEALGTLAGGVAHDLNNVLGVLVGYSELLTEQMPADSFPRRCADNILKSSIRGAAIIQDLLTLARRGVNVAKVLNLNSLVFDYLKTPEFEKMQSYHPDVQIVTELEESLLNIKGSPIHLSKTIMNLLSNAAEAISGAGIVTIRTENRYLDHPVRGYDVMKEGDYVVLEVSDTGAGISADDLDKIFEPFYTKKVMGRSGTGLGLAVVWGTVKDHDGYIDVQSDAGKGTNFTLYFPVTREEPDEIAKDIPRIDYMGEGESILIVDDVKEQREMALHMLEKLEYHVEAVASGEEAIEYLKNKKADLIVLDMIMEPGMDGMEAYRRILEIDSRQKAVIVSGFSENERVKKTREMGAAAFVRKPYILEKIGLAVRKELDRK